MSLLPVTVSLNISVFLYLCLTLRLSCAYLGLSSVLGFCSLLQLSLHLSLPLCLSPHHCLSSLFSLSITRPLFHAHLSISGQRVLSLSEQPQSQVCARVLLGIQEERGVG